MTLGKVLKQSEHVKTLLQESTDELSSVNATIKEEVLNGVVTTRVKNVLQKNETVEVKVTDASDKLTTVNKALEREIEDRDSADQHIAALEEKEESARHAAFHDLLTGLPNRALFIDRLEHGLDQAARHDRTLAVMFIDLDQFKRVNDTYGHDAGDAVLRIAAQRLKESARDNDTVSRYGGDEFLYLLTDFEDEKSVAILARRIIRSIHKESVLSVHDQRIRSSIGASIGISIFPRDGITADSLVKSADTAMYRAKHDKTGYAFAHIGAESTH
jgi:diguanylate cyclase (GGDEF)-like protein